MPVGLEMCSSIQKEQSSAFVYDVYSVLYPSRQAAVGADNNWLYGQIRAEF